MNIGGIKSFLGGQDAVNSDGMKERLPRQSELRQANSPAFQPEGSLSSRYSVAYTALSLSMTQNIKVDGQSPDKPSPPKSPPEEQAFEFNFEEVVDNVMKFVSKVILGAAQSKESDENLTSMFKQAREGVTKGISAARDDLKNVMNDELSEGIDQVEKGLDKRITQLEQDVFSPERATFTSASNVSTSASAELSIQTKDGDTLTLSFEQSTSATVAQQVAFTQPVVSSDDENSDDNVNQALQANRYASFMQQFGVSFTVQGELDADEINAVGGLVEQIASIADDFFNGDVESAFENALSLGYDDSEILSFSAEISKQQSVSALRAYENVQSYNEDEKPSIPDATLRSINQYVDKMLNTMDVASDTLNSREDYNSIVSGILNFMDDDLKVPDLLSAMNRFYQFNQRIIDNVEAKGERVA